MQGPLFHRLILPYDGPTIADSNWLWGVESLQIISFYFYPSHPFSFPFLLYFAFCIVFLSIVPVFRYD